MTIDLHVSGWWCLAFLTVVVILAALRK